MSQEHSFKLKEARKAIILSRNATQGWILPGVVTKTVMQRALPKGRGRFPWHRQIQSLEEAQVGSTLELNS